MTLLIACLLIYHLNMAGWWYGVAVVIWLGRSAVIYSAYADLERSRK
jgi:hypothetical protein